MSEEVFYEGYLLCERFMIEHLYYFRLENDKLTYWADKDRKKVGCFHMAISEFKMDQDGKEIKIDSGTAQFVLKYPKEESSFELNTWFNKMVAAQKKAVGRGRSNQKNNLQVELEQRDLSEDIVNEVNQIWGLISSTEELIQSLSERFQNNSMLVDYGDKITNFSRQLKRHVEKLLISVDEQRRTNIFKKNIHRQNYEEPEEPSFYSVVSSFEKDSVTFDDYRTTLPKLDGKIFTIDYTEVMGNWKNKQLYEMRLPIIMYEPLSFLQRMTEKFEFSFLLSRADTEKDPAMRMAYAVAFAICPFYNLKYRLRLPFETVKGETFNYTDERSQVNISSEALSTGYHIQHFSLPRTESAECRSFHYSQQTKLIGKFYGNNFEFKLVGPTNLRFKSCDEVIEWNRPHILIRNIMTNNPFPELTGELRFKNDKLKIKAEVVFTGDGTCFTCNIYEVDKTLKMTLVQEKEGAIYATPVGSKKRLEIWRPNDKEQLDPRFRFSKYALQLNYIPYSLAGKIADNDSRMRKDIRLLEDGKIQSCQKERNAAWNQQGGSPIRRSDNASTKKKISQKDVVDPNEFQTKDLVPYEEITAQLATEMVDRIFSKQSKPKGEEKRIGTQQKAIDELITKKR